jgi:excisionase family DNA binding protein
MAIESQFPEIGALTIREFCRWSGIGATKTFSEIREGRLRAVKFGKRTLVRLDDARRWLDALPQREVAAAE